MTNYNDSAFPQPEYYNEQVVGHLPGLSKREIFAALAMQGLCANSAFEGLNDGDIANIAVNQADELIKRLNKR